MEAVICFPEWVMFTRGGARRGALLLSVLGQEDKIGEVLGGRNLLAWSGVSVRLTDVPVAAAMAYEGPPGWDPAAARLRPPAGPPSSPAALGAAFFFFKYILLIFTEREGEGWRES